jgi:hypothetical protein
MGELDAVMDVVLLTFGARKLVLSHFYCDMYLYVFAL